MKIHINREWCKGCGVCVAFCRVQALLLDEEGKAACDPGRCVGCGLCELYCPDLAVECLDDAPKAEGEKT